MKLFKEIKFWIASTVLMCFLFIYVSISNLEYRSTATFYKNVSDSICVHNIKLKTTNSVLYYWLNYYKNTNKASYPKEIRPILPPPEFISKKSTFRI